MLNQMYDAIEEVLESLDAGGEQSREFAEEITTLKEVLGYPKPGTDALDETLRRCQISRKLERLAIQVKGIAVDLPTLPVNQWLDGTFEDAAVDVSFESCDLAKLLQFIANFGLG